MRRSRREFLRTVPLAAAALAFPLSVGSQATVLACSEVTNGVDAACGAIANTPDGAIPGFQPWWVQAFLPTKIWPSPNDVDNPIGRAEPGQYFRVQAPQDGSRLRVWDPRGDRLAYIGAEAVGPVGAPYWAEFLNGLDGRWIKVNLNIPQNAIAMLGDQPLRRALVTAGLQGTTRPGDYSILRRVANETMDSRTVPGLSDHYLLHNVLFTQYFTGDGAAIHYNWWFPPGGFGRPGSHGCLGMMYDDSKYFWDWADVGVPVIIRA